MLKPSHEAIGCKIRRYDEPRIGPLAPKKIIHEA